MDWSRDAEGPIVDKQRPIDKEERKKERLREGTSDEKVSHSFFFFFLEEKDAPLILGERAYRRRLGYRTRSCFS